MKKYIYLIIAICFIILIYSPLIINSCNYKDKNKLPVEIQNYDSLYNEYDYLCHEHNALYFKYDSLEFYSRKANDSLNYQCIQYRHIIDSLEEELMISNYKLERIAEYNRIAAQGNNITFLRGWINRVLKE